VGLGWLLGCLALLSVGELLIGALGPSFVLRLAPSARGGRWLGAWYGATALGFWLAGRIGGLWDSVPHALFFAGMVVLALGRPGHRGRAESRQGQRWRASLNGKSSPPGASYDGAVCRG
jgi:hypothetical protein